MPPACRDERVRHATPLARRLLARPELGRRRRHDPGLPLLRVRRRQRHLLARCGIVTFLEVSAQLGILAVAAALLMIGGEFDLSIGSMIGFAGVAIAIPAVAVGLAAVAVHPAGLRGRGRGRRRQRPDRGPHRPALVHRHAGRPVHPARADHRLHPPDHRPDPGLGPVAAGRAGLAGAALRRQGRPRRVRLARQQRLDRGPHRRHAARPRHPDVDRLVGRPDRGRHLGPAAHPGRQLDLRRRRRRQRGAQRRRAGRQR